MNLALIIDKSNAYVEFQKEILLGEWFNDSSKVETQTINNLYGAKGDTLFGTSPLHILELEKASDATELGKVMKDFDIDALEEMFATGLIIIGDIPGNSLKTLKKTVADLGGKVFVTKSSETIATTEKIVDCLTLNKDSRRFLIDYAGENYSSLLPLIKDLSKLDEAQQKNLTLEELYIRLPQAPGALPPWNIEKYLFNGNTRKAIETMERVTGGGLGAHLLSLAVIRNKLNLILLMKMVQLNDPTIKFDEALEKLDLKNNYGNKIAFQRARKFDLDEISSIVRLVYDAEWNIKGGSPVPSHVIMNALFAKLAKDLKGKG